MRSGRLFWGLLIMVVGVILLLEPLGILPEGANAWKFIWPSVIILLGIWMLIVPLFSRGQKMDVETLSIPLDGAREARVRLKHGAGKMSVAAQMDDLVLLEGEFGGGIDQSLHRDGDTVKIKLRTPAQVYPFPSVVTFEGLNWKVGLNRSIPIRLDVDSGASDTVLDLNDLKITELNVDTGASSTEINLPMNAGFTRVHVDSGAASIVIRVPEQVSARITVESSLAGINIDSRRFPRAGRAYESPDFEQAANKAEILVKTGVGSLDIR